ncbi:SdrD B-like domain-containing protein [Methylobacillus pratensis]
MLQRFVKVAPGIGKPETRTNVNVPGRWQVPLRALVFSVAGLAAVPAFAANVLVSGITDTPDPVFRGGDVVYTIPLNNNDSVDPANDVTLTIPLPPTTLYQGATMTGGTCPAAGSVIAPNSVVCTLSAPMPPNGSATVVLTLRTTAATNTFGITATVATSSTDTNLGDNVGTQNTTVQNGADMQITSVSGAPDPVAAGGNVTWNVSGQNAGPNDAPSSTVTMTLPGTLTFVPAGSGGDGFNCTASGQLVTCTRNTPLASGNTFDGLNIVTTVNGVGTGNVSVTPTISAPVGDPFPDNNTPPEASVVVNAGSDLSIPQIAPNPVSATSGGSVTFIMQPTNSGPSDASSGVAASYTLPAGFTYVSSNAPAGWSCAPPAGQVVTCERLGNYPNGTVNDITIVATAPAVAGLQNYSGTATIAHLPGGPADPNPGNNSSTEALNVKPEGPGPTISKERSPGPVAAGQNMTSTIRVGNAGNGPAPANTIIVTDTINTANETFVSYSGNGWSCSPVGSGGGNSLDAAVSTVTCRYGPELAAGENAPALQIVTKAGDVNISATNTAAVSCEAVLPACWYPGPATVNANVTISSENNSVDLGITKTVTTPNSDHILDANESAMTYTLVVTNHSPSVGAENIVVSDPIPGYCAATGCNTPSVVASYVASDPSVTFSCVMDSATLRCTQSAGILPPNGTVTFTVPVSRDLQAFDGNNTATVRSATQGDTNGANNTGSTPVRIMPLADVEMVSKVVTPTQGEAGTNVSYTLSFRNNGTDAAQNVTVTDEFVVAPGDPGFTVVSVTPSTGVSSCSGLNVGQSYGAGTHTIACQVGALGRAVARTVNIVVRPNWKSGQVSGQTWNIDNTARISTDTPENVDGTDGGNNSKTAQFIVQAASVDLLVNNIDNVDPLGYDPSNGGDNPQNDVIYTINMVNSGPSLATGLKFTYSITPPAGKTARFLGDSAAMGPPADSICDNIGSEVSSPTSGPLTTLTVTCTFTGEAASLANGEARNRYLSVRMLSEPSASGDVYNSIAEVSANETDANQANNTEAEATSVRDDIPSNNLSLGGRVYIDINDDGAWNGPGETGIGGVTVTLTGTASDGTPVSRTVQTNADGSYVFTGLPPSNGAGYAVVQAQPAGYTDGKDRVGSAGSSQGPSGTVLNAGTDTFTGIVLTQSATGYDFGETSAPGALASLSGHVWLDGNHDRTFNSTSPDSADVPQSGWAVELLRNGTQVASTVTDANGFYNFINLPPGSGYQVRFRHPVTGLVYGFARPNERGLPFDPGVTSPANPGGASNVDGTLSGITLSAGDNLVEQSLPLDPAGKVYDAVTRQPVAGATVTISGPPGFTPAAHLVNGNATQTTGIDGTYQFLLNQNAPAGLYTLEVTQYPSGYIPQPSSMIPVCNATLQVGATPDPALVQQNGVPPAEAVGPHDPATCSPTTGDGSFALGGAGGGTRYYFNILIDPATSAELLNNHIPLDPVLGGIIRITKTTPLVNVVRGDLVPYTVTATSSVAINNITITDRLPPGFKYRTGSASVNGVRIEPEVNGRDLAWANQTFSAGETKTFKLILVVGTGVGEGEYTNQAWAENALVSTLVSNIGSATVKVTPDPTFDCSDIIGKVFDDKNANGYQDQGEPGIPNARVVTARGLLVTTDAEGRFHVTCADIPNMDRGANFVMKLDERTLPSGYRVTTENPRDVRVTRGKMVKLNFGATVHRVVRLDLNDQAFVPDGIDLQSQWQHAFADMVKQLDGRPSVLRVAYDPGGGGEKLAKKRLDGIAKAARKLWKETHNNNKDEAAFPLIIETAVEVQP